MRNHSFIPLKSITAFGATLFVVLLASSIEAAPAVFTRGSLQILSPWLRATPNGAKVAGGYVEISNKGSVSDRLLTAAIPLAPKGSIHEMHMEDGMMHMQALPDGLEIKPGETIALKPGGYHIMFEGLTQPLKPGDKIEGTLTFAKAGKVDVTFAVGDIAAMTPPAASEPLPMPPQ